VKYLLLNKVSVEDIADGVVKAMINRARFQNPFSKAIINHEKELPLVTGAF
jgi:hypothetical protein